MRIALRLFLLGTLAAGAYATPACDARDCSEDRVGQVRCVRNRIETCNDDGTLTYVSCTPQGLVCSEEKQACVTDEVAMSTSGAGGGGGAGGAGDGGDGGA